MAKCHACNKVFNEKSTVLECSRCQKVVHATPICSGLSTKQLAALKAAENLEWTCSECNQNSSRRKSFVTLADCDDEDDDEVIVAGASFDMKQIYDNNRKPSYCIDASNASKSNWMRYVNCARHWSEQNLVAFQYQGLLYYRTIKIIPRCTELLVFYGSEFANELDIDLGKYNSPTYARAYDVTDKKRKLNDEDSKLTQQLRNEPILQDIDNVNDNLNESADISYINNNDTTVDAFMTKDNTEHLNNKTEINKGIPVGKSGVDSLQTNFSYLFCDTCNEKFILENDLEKHMRFHDKTRIYDCNLCTFRFTSIEILKKHKLFKHKINNHNLKMHDCEICEKTFFIPPSRKE